MFLKPSASHCVQNTSPDLYNPSSAVLSCGFICTDVVNSKVSGASNIESSAVSTWYSFDVSTLPSMAIDCVSRSLLPSSTRLTASSASASGLRTTFSVRRHRSDVLMDVDMQVGFFNQERRDLVVLQINRLGLTFFHSGLALHFGTRILSHFARNDPLLLYTIAHARFP